MQCNAMHYDNNLWLWLFVLWNTETHTECAMRHFSLHIYICIYLRLFVFLAWITYLFIECFRNIVYLIVSKYCCFNCGFSFYKFIPIKCFSLIFFIIMTEIHLYASSKFVVSPKNKRRHFFSGKKLYDEIDKQEKNRYKHSHRVHWWREKKIVKWKFKMCHAMSYD